MPLITPITHVIFDLDGTLLDTEPAYRAVGGAIASRYGHVFDESIRERMMGRPDAVSARIFVEALGIPLTAEEFITEREMALEALFMASVPMPGALALTRYFEAHGIPRAIATSSNARTLAYKMAAHPEWLATFDAIVS